MPPQFHPQPVVFGQPLLGNPAIVLTRPGGLAALNTGRPAPPAAAPATASAAVGAHQRRPSTDSTAAGSAGRPASGEAPGSPSFMQAALALLKEGANSVAPVGSGSGAAADSGSGARVDSAGGNSSSSREAAPLPAGVLQAASSTPCSTFGAPGATPFALAPLPVGAQPVGVAVGTAAAAAAGGRPRRGTAQQAASVFNLVGAGSDGGSVLGERPPAALVRFYSCGAAACA